MLELVAYGFFRFQFGDYVRHDLQLERIQTIERIEREVGADQADSANIGKLTKEVLHPYTGYTVDGKVRKKDCLIDQNASAFDCYERIRKPDDLAMPKRGPGVLNVALLGGSVAVGTVNGAPPKYYQTRLSALPEYKGFKVNLHMLAAGGYRQPQSLMMLNYYYTLGAEYDLIISLDGFNEIAIASNEFKWNKQHPIYPRSWASRVANRIDPQVVTLQAKRVLSNQAHVGRAKFMSNLWARNSPLSNLFWKILHARYLASESALILQMESHAPDADIPRDFRYEALGPDYNFHGWDSVIEDSAKIWARANYLVHGIAESHGATFFHFVQPNQYIDGAKPVMSELERATAFIDPAEGGYGLWYKQGYPFLKQQQAWLLDKGVKSRDLTFMYQNHVGPIYIDNCCHVNSEGSAMIVEAIVDTIHQHNLANQAQP